MNGWQVTRREFLALTGLGLTALAAPELAGAAGGGIKTPPKNKLPYRPYILSPYDRGMIIEDVWPTIYFGDGVINEIKRKAGKLSWAKQAVKQMEAEAEGVFSGPPQLPMEPAGWRHDFYSRSTAEHLLYDCNSPDKYLDPSTGIYENDDAQRKAWVLLTHERTYRIMRSLAVLYKITGDEKYAKWISAGMREACDYFTHSEFKHAGALYYQPLYDAAVLSILASIYSLTRESVSYTTDDHKRIREQIFEERMPSQLEFLKVHPTHNMSCYVSSALALSGKLYENKEWLQAGLGESSGLRRQLEKGIPADENGQVDGLWYEGTMFYHFYSLCPLVMLWEADRQMNGMLHKDSDLKKRFTEMFAAPVALADNKLRVPVIGDLGCTRVINLASYRHLYEYAAGKLDPERFGSVLASIYDVSGASRNELAALAFGPDELPKSVGIPTGHTILPVAKMGVFRAQKPNRLHVVFRAGKYMGGHDHPDRLSLYLSAFDRPISPDLGTAGYSLHKKVHNYYRTTLAHNTIFADEKQQTGSAELEWKPEADTPMARGIIADKDGIRYQRTVFFVSNYVVVLDEYAAEQEHRFNWVFHAHGKVNVTSALKGPDDPAALHMPPLSSEGEYVMFTDRRSGTSTDMLSAVWSVGGGVSFKMLTVSDGPFEVTAGRTPGQPIGDELGCILLRVPGNNRRFATIFEPTKGASTVNSISIDGDAVTVSLNGGVKQTFRWV